MRHLKKFNESLSINNREKFLNKFKINIEDIEDYLTELSDEYDVLVLSMEEHPNVRAKILSFGKLNSVDKYSFVIMIWNNAYDWCNSENFDSNRVMKKMKTFINRIEFKYKHIKFDSYKLNDKLKSVEYIFKMNI